ncbi:MAG: phage tail protein [Amaricoccus sp.]
MPPVGAAIGAFSGLGASISTALGGAALSGFAARAFAQIAVGSMLSAVGRMLAPKPKLARQGVRTSVGFGEDAPASIVLGRYATAGDLVYAGSYGPNNATYVLVLELGDLPARLHRVMVNGEWVTLSATETDKGRGVVEYRDKKGEDTLWIKVFDGTQTSTSPYLLEVFGDDPDRPWQADMVGRGIPYAVVSAKFNPKIHRGIPECLFELNGARLYDPRRDSSIGGAGPQRWTNPATWSGFGDAANENPVVQIYNLMLGLKDPVTGEHLWGGSDIPQRDLPVASWFAAMNECDREMPSADGDEPQYRAGIEIALEEETAPADVIETLLAGCQGQIAEAAGSWVIRAGPPAAPVFAFSDDDVIVTSPEELDPFPGLDQVFSGISARYPEPEDGWNDKDAPRRVNAGYVIEDGGRLRVASLSFPSVPFRAQVQRLMASALKDGRRFRRHTVVLPPEARALGPLDTVAWTSDRHGYDGKQFTVDLIEDLPSGCVALALREVDPSDYDFAAGELLPTSVGFLGRPDRLPQPLDFGAEGVSLPDAAGNARRPGIRLDWNPLRQATGVRYQLQLLDRPDDLPLLGGHDTSDDDWSPSYLEVFAGVPLEVEADAPLVADTLSDILAGTTIITANVLPAACYRIRARYVPNGGWCPWIDVETPDTRVSAIDLDAALNSRIDTAASAAEAAAADAAAALGMAQDALDQVTTLAGDTISDLEHLLEELGGMDTGDIVAARTLALAALQTGWNADPTFQLWSSGTLDRWSTAGLSTSASPFAGVYGGGLALDIPAGASAATLIASSAVSGQMPAADAEAPWLVLYALVTFTAGSPEALRVRAEWLAHGASAWTRGDMLGLTAPLATFSQHGLAARPGQAQGFEVLVKRPPALGANADGVRLVLEKVSSVTTAVDCDLHLLGLRKATEAEVLAGQAPGALSAAIATQQTAITGISDALAALSASLATTAPGGVVSLLASTYLTAAQTNTAISAASTSLSASIAGVTSNLATNYYTRVQTDAGITSAVAALNTTLGAQIGANAAAISDEAALRVAGDSTLAGRIGTLEARRDPGAVVSNGSFADGLFTGWSGATVPAQFSVVARGGTVSAQQNAPAAFMAKIAIDATTTRTVVNERFEAHPGDRVSAGFMYAAGGTTPSVSLRIVIRWLDAAGTSLGVTSVGIDAYAGTAWARFTSDTLGPAPAGTAFVRIELSRLAGGVGDAYVTGVDVRKGDPAALARITATEAVATSAQGAISTLSGLITASFGTQSAFVSQTQSAVARVDALSSTWVMRQKAGAAVGVAEAVAFNTPGGAAISTLKWSYDYIDLDGRVGARDLVISDSTNLVPDEQLQTNAVWNPSKSAEWTLYPVSGDVSSLGTAGTLGVLKWNNTGVTTGSAILTAGQAFPVRPGDVLACSFRTRNTSGTAQYYAYAQLQFLDKDGAAIASPSTVALSTPTVITHNSNVSWPTKEVTVPAGAWTARWRWVVDRAQTTALVLLFSAPVVRRQAQTVEIADGAITAAKANFSDLGAVCATLGSCTITSALNFADGVVITDALANFAVSRTAWAATGTSVPTARNAWATIQTVTMTRRAGSSMLMIGAFGWDGAGSNPGNTQVRFKRGSGVLNTFSIERPARDGGNAIHQWIDSASVSGAQSYTMDIWIPSGYDSGFSCLDATVYLQELVK